MLAVSWEGEKLKLIEVVDLKKYYTVKTPVFGIETAKVKAVNGVSFHIDRGKP